MVSRLLDDLLGRVARGVGCTLGQAYTLVVGLVVAVLLLATGIPPALQHRDVTRAAQRAPRPRATGTPTAMTPPTPPPGAAAHAPDIGMPLPFPDWPVAPTPGEHLTEPSSPVDRDNGPRPPASPLWVVSSGWASVGGGTPAATVGVPLGTLPVAHRVGTLDKATFVRLVGTADFLVLPTDPAGARDPVVGAVGVRACRIHESDWEEGNGVPFEEAPTWDTGKCVQGVRAASGHWSFDLGAYPDRADARGFALVPAPDAAPDFQITFSPT